MWLFSQLLYLELKSLPGGHIVWDIYWGYLLESLKKPKQKNLTWLNIITSRSMTSLLRFLKWSFFKDLEKYDITVYSRSWVCNYRKKVKNNSDAWPNEMELVNCSLDEMFSNNFACGFMSNCMSSTFENRKYGVLCKLWLMTWNRTISDDNDAYEDT